MGAGSGLITCHEVKPVAGPCDHVDREFEQISRDQLPFFGIAPPVLRPSTHWPSSEDFSALNPSPQRYDLELTSAIVFAGPT